MYDAINFSHSGHEESYNPSVEYVPTQEEIDSYQLLYEEDRPKFIPRRYSFIYVVIMIFLFWFVWGNFVLWPFILCCGLCRFESLRSVPAYEKALREGFDRCLDLYLCPRTRKKRVSYLLCLLLGFQFINFYEYIWVLISWVPVYHLLLWSSFLMHDDYLAILR
jgi:hypothetical protein